MAFLKCIETDEGINDNTCKQYAYLALGETDKAIAYHRQAIDNGYRNIRHMEKDDDMDNIRDMKEFQELLKSIRKMKNLWK